jgi:hypothetical protein
MNVANLNKYKLGRELFLHDLIASVIFFSPRLSFCKVAIIIFILMHKYELKFCLIIVCKGSKSLVSGCPVDAGSLSTPFTKGPQEA